MATEGAAGGRRGKGPGVELRRRPEFGSPPLGQVEASGRRCLPSGPFVIRVGDGRLLWNKFRWGQIKQKNVFFSMLLELSLILSLLKHHFPRKNGWTITKEINMLQNKYEFFLWESSVWKDGRQIQKDSYILIRFKERKMYFANTTLILYVTILHAFYIHTFW